jgi:hypothetical protein
MIQYAFLRNFEQCTILICLSVVYVKYKNVLFDLTRWIRKTLVFFSINCFSSFVFI